VQFAGGRSTRVVGRQALRTSLAASVLQAAARLVALLRSRRTRTAQACCMDPVPVAL
jgi:hypothetical protein